MGEGRPKEARLRKGGAAGCSDSLLLFGPALKKSCLECSALSSKKSVLQLCAVRDVTSAASLPAALDPMRFCNVRQ